MKIVLATIVSAMLLGVVPCNPQSTWEECQSHDGVWPSHSAMCLEWYACSRALCDPWYTPYFAENLYECVTGVPVMATWITWMGHDPVDALPLFINIKE